MCQHGSLANLVDSVTRSSALWMTLVLYSSLVPMIKTSFGSVVYCHQGLDPVLFLLLEELSDIHEYVVVLVAMYLSVHCVLNNICGLVLSGREVRFAGYLV